MCVLKQFHLKETQDKTLVFPISTCERSLVFLLHSTVSKRRCPTLNRFEAVKYNVKSYTCRKLSDSSMVETSQEVRLTSSFNAQYSKSQVAFVQPSAHFKSVHTRLRSSHLSLDFTQLLIKRLHFEGARVRYLATVYLYCAV